MSQGNPTDRKIGKGIIHNQGGRQHGNPNNILQPEEHPAPQGKHSTHLQDMEHQTRQELLEPSNQETTEIQQETGQDLSPEETRSHSNRKTEIIKPQGMQPENPTELPEPQILGLNLLLTTWSKGTEKKDNQEKDTADKEEKKEASLKMEVKKSSWI